MIPQGNHHLTPEEEHLNLEETNDFADTVGLVNDATMCDAAQTIYHRDEYQRRTAHPLPYAAGHWQGNKAQDGDADGDHYQAFKVDEDHDTSLTPEKMQFKSKEVDSPDVFPLTQFLSKPPPHKNVLTTKTMRKHLMMCGMKTGLGMPRWMNDKNLLFIQGVVFLPLQKSGKSRGNWTQQLTTLTLYGVVSIVTFVAAVEQWQSEFQTVY